MMDWLEDLIREIAAERPGIIFGSPAVNPTEVLDFLENLEEKAE